MARCLPAMLAFLALAATAAHEPSDDFEDHVGALVVLMQQGETEAPVDVASYTAEQFSGLINKIITRASQMRVVMNKLGISDTDSVQDLEEHFVRLGTQHADLGEGMTSVEELRQHGLKARACVQYATSCSREAAGCQGSPSECFGDDKVVVGCTRAAASCGVGELGESSDPKDDPALIDAHKAALKKEQKQPSAAPAPAPATPEVGNPTSEASTAAKPEAPQAAKPAATDAHKAALKKEQKQPAAAAALSPATPEVGNPTSEASTAAKPEAPQAAKPAAPAATPPTSDEELELLQLDLEEELPGLIDAGVKNFM